MKPKEITHKFRKSKPKIKEHDQYQFPNKLEPNSVHKLQQDFLIRKIMEPKNDT